MMFGDIPPSGLEDVFEAIIDRWMDGTTGRTSVQMQADATYPKITKAHLEHELKAAN